MNKYFAFYFFFNIFLIFSFSVWVCVCRGGGLQLLIPVLQSGSSETHRLCWTVKQAPDYRLKAISNLLLHGSSDMTPSLPPAVSLTPPFISRVHLKERGLKFTAIRNSVKFLGLVSCVKVARSLV